MLLQRWSLARKIEHKTCYGFRSRRSLYDLWASSCEGLKWAFEFRSQCYILLLVCMYVCMYVNKCALKRWSFLVLSEMHTNFLCRVISWNTQEYRCSVAECKNKYFCRRRQNKLKLLRSKNRWYVMIRSFICMKSICSCVFSWSHALKTTILKSF